MYARGGTAGTAIAPSSALCSCAALAAWTALSGLFPSRIARRKERPSSHVRGISSPTLGSSGGFACTMPSRRWRSALSDASPPWMHETHATPGWTRRRRVPFASTSGRKRAWCASMVSMSHCICFAHAASIAGTVHSASRRSMRSQCVSTGCTTASGAPTCR